MPGLDTFFHYFNLTLEVFFLDVLLSGDNAVVIALACRALPPAQKRRALFIGTGCAIALRIILTVVASLLLSMTALKLVGGVTLVVIAIKLILGEGEEASSAASTAGQNASLWAAIRTIMVADVVMSVDNVLGLAAVTQGSLLFLVLGLLLSVPLLMFGSLFVGVLLQRYPLLIQAGGALLGWVAGDMAMTDPLLADWVNQQAPALTVVMPILVTVFVLVESRILQEAQRVVRPPERMTSMVIATARPLASVPAIGVSAPVSAPRQGTHWLREWARNRMKPVWVVMQEHFLGHRRPTASELVGDGPTSPGEEPPGQRTLSSLLAVHAPRLGIVLSIALVWLLLSYMPAVWMPKPVELDRYYCPKAYTFVFYRHGGNTVRMLSPFGSITGFMRSDKIDWGDYPVASKTLGFLPPLSIQYRDTQGVRLEGGLYAGIDCLAQPVTPPLGQ
ncbi:MAG: TerC family protein [Magnetococcales bacterium]|nr:TerC family protein [Magnetococcales bacterium]